jgi:hypothetical protein
MAAHVEHTVHGCLVADFAFVRPIPTVRMLASRAENIHIKGTVSPSPRATASRSSRALKMFILKGQSRAPKIFILSS